MEEASLLPRVSIVSGYLILLYVSGLLELVTLVVSGSRALEMWKSDLKAVFCFANKQRRHVASRCKEKKEPVAIVLVVGRRRLPECLPCSTKRLRQLIRLHVICRLMYDAYESIDAGATLKL